MSKRISYKVHGTVQGVFFRDSTVTQAKTIGVTGFVKNATDGSVRGEAQGTEGQLKEFVQYLNQGPPAAKVTTVEQLEISVKQGESGFRQ